MTARKFERPLTKAELALVLGAVEHAPSPLAGLVDGLVTFFTLAIEEAEGITWEQMMADPEKSLTPWQYAIPAAQWCQIGEAISARQGHLGPLAQTNHLLDWMNKGPSSYEPVTS